MAVLDILFILLVVPESLPERMRPASWGAPVSWEQADPFNVSSRLKVHSCTRCSSFTRYFLLPEVQKKRENVFSTLLGPDEIRVLAGVASYYQQCLPS